MAATHPLRYRPDIDGLRALAVLAVVFFHAGFGCPGGYVGVDVFFVISGFLITSLIWKDLESGRFTFVNFWERRARRIVPALVVVTLATLLAGWFVLLPVDFKDLGRAAAAQAVFAANLHYWQVSGYFAGAADEKPLLHTWSLAVEEQFYLVVPFLLWGLHRSGRLRRRRSIGLGLAGAFVASFGLSVYGVAHHREATFYFLPTRAWELLIGAMVAFLPDAPPFLDRRPVREACAWTGLALVLVPIFTYTPQTPFPGLGALPPCLGASLLIWANRRPEQGAPTVLNALLSVRPVVAVGLISYSLYLWHWPLIAFGHYLALTPLSLGYRLLILGGGFALGVLSWRFVETPFRVRTLGASRSSMFAFAGVGLAAVLGAGLLCVFAQGFPHRLSPQAQAFANAKTGQTFTNLTTDDIRAGRLVRLGATDPTLRPAVLVWGDSHAWAALPAVDAFLKERGLSGRAALHSLTAPLLGWYRVREFGLSRDAIPYNDAVFANVQSQRIPVVLLVASWTGYLDENGHDTGNAVPLDTALLATVRRLVAAGVHPWVMLDVPGHSFDVPKALACPVYSRAYVESLCARPTPRNELAENDPQIIHELEAAGAHVLDPKPRFLDPTGQRYIIQADGVALYSDAHHLTPQGAERMLLPLFRGSLAVEK